MLKINTFLITLFLSFNASASKARLSALTNSFHIVDVQNVYKNPIQLLYLDNVISFETGVAAASTISNGAEAFVNYEFLENQRLGFSFGHQDESVLEARNFINLITLNNYDYQQNPINFFYGKKNSITSYGVGILYSNKNDKITSAKESSLAINFAVEMGNWQVGAKYVVANSAQTLLAKKFEGLGAINNYIYYQLDDVKFELTYLRGGVRSLSTSGLVTIDEEAHLKEVITLGLADDRVSDVENFFWGAEVISTKISCFKHLSIECNKFFTSTSFPIWFGIEIEALDWLTLRGAVKQSFMVASAKDEVGYPAGSAAATTGAVSDYLYGVNNTTVTAGAGLLYKNITLDGTLSAASTQVVNGTSLLLQLGLTYKY